MDSSNEMALPNDYQADIDAVMDHLGQVALDSQQQPPPLTQCQFDVNDNLQTQLHTMDTHWFCELERTIPNTLEIMKARCEQLSEDQWMLGHVYPALEFVFSLLKEHNMSSSNVAVTSFCNALVRFQRYLRVAISESSMFQYARSRKVTRTHGVVYSELDRLLDTLNVPEADPIRAWKLNEDSALHLVSVVPSNAVADDTTIQLMHFESSAPCHAFWKKAELAELAAYPSWYLSLASVLFSEVDPIGEGAFGLVYRGSWSNTLVAIKLMGYEADAKTISTDLLLHEARVWHRLNHPHVLKLYGACHVDKRFFMCEYAPNGDLSDFLKKPGNKYLTWQMLLEAALGLEYLHDMNVAHNDLKCDNIMIGMDGKAKLIDFGLSCLVGEAEIQIDVKNMGAVHWKSPEYLTGGQPSFASDVYSFAMCIIEAVSGEIPWGHVHPAGVRFQVVKRGKIPLLPESMSEKQRKLIELMTNKDSLKRVQMAFVVAKLREFVHIGEDTLEKMDKHHFPELEYATIPDTLKTVKLKCDRLPDDHWMGNHVYPALHFTFNLLAVRELSPTAVVVASFCTVLTKVQRHLRTALSEDSVLCRARSLEARTHGVIYADLDRLFDMLNVADADPIRAWRLDPTFGSYQTRNLDGDWNFVERNESPVQLTSFKTPTSTNALWTKAGLANTGSNPSWYLSPADIVFSEADQIGESAFGGVYKGSWGDTPIVVKSMGYEADAGTISTDLMLHEVRVWHRLNHPHVLRLYGACHVNKRYFVCEYASNGELSDFLKKPGNELLTWQKLLEAALGLQYMHGMNVAHNDLKCDNIMVGMDGNAKLIDFGLSSLIGEAEIQIQRGRIGAVNWRSPEYLMGGRPSFASDVYSFAMCIIEAVSGEIPWGRNVTIAAQIRYQLMRGNIPNLPESMNQKQRKLIQLMTKKEPTERVKMTFVVAKLGEFAQDERASHGAP